MNKKLVYLLSLVVGVMLAFFTLGGVAQAADEHLHTSHDGWTAVTELPPPAAETQKVYLTQDINLSSTYTLLANQKLFICLNGHNINGGGANQLFLFGGNGATLVICNCSDHDETHGIIDAKASENAKFSGKGQVICSEQSNYSIGLYNITIQNAHVNSEGGVLYIVNSYTLNVGNIVVKNCSSSGSGGAFRLHNGSSWIKDSTFSECISGGSGGAIFNNGGSWRTLEISGVTVERCSATNYGGGFYLESGGATHLRLLHSKLDGCHSNAAGGGLYYYKYVNAGATVTIDSTEFVNCNSGTYGGGFYLSDESKLLESATIGNNSVFDGCSSVYEGGGFYNRLATVNMADCIFKKCSTTGSGRSGGAIYNKGSLNITDSVIGGSEADANHTGSGDCHGGGIACYTSDAKLTLENTELSYNYASHSGNLSVVSGAQVTIKAGTKIAHGKAKVNYAGNVGIYNANSILTMESGEISDGESPNHAGNLFVRDSGSSFIMTGGTIKNGIAKKYGGNIVSSGSTTISGNAWIESGNASGNGGNIYASAGTITINSATISSGEANTGGNLFFEGSANATITNTTISGGVSKNGPDGNGGNLRVYSGASATLGVGTVITMESDSARNVDVKDGTLTIDGAIISGGIDSVYAKTPSDDKTTILTLTAGYFDAIGAGEGSTVTIANNACYFLNEPTVGLTNEQEAYLGDYKNGDKTYTYKVDVKGRTRDTFAGISGTIGESFAVVFRITKGTLEGMTPSTLVVQTRAGEKVIEANVEGNYVLSLNPEELTVNLQAKLMSGDMVLAQKADYCAADYVKAVAELEGTTVAIKTMLADLLEYGAAAQNYYNFRTFDPANQEANRWDGYQASTFTAPTAEAFTISNANDELRFRSANLFLENDTVAVQFKGIAPEGTTFTGGNVTVAGSNFTLKTAPIKMSELADAAYTVTAKNGDAVSTVTYSVKNYIVSKTVDYAGNPSMKALAERLWCYGLSAAAAK